MTMLDVTPQTRADAVVLGGRFLLDQRAGRAGVAELWRAQDVVLRRPVAVHLLPERAPVPGLAAAVRAAARVSDPRLAPIFDACYDPERPYLVSEWAGDPSLERLLLTAGLPGPGLAARIVAEAAEALATAHAHGRPHLRLDLGKLHWGASGLKITGLGIDAALTGTALTQTALTGTGSPAPAAADTAALARILYALLTGYQPDAAASSWHDPRELRPEVPPMLSAITCHALPAWGTPSIGHPAQLAAALRAAAQPPAQPRPYPRFAPAYAGRQ
jgi:serine/threonine protein kinase